MKEQYEVLALVQQNLEKMLDELSVEQMNKVPDGYKNNLVWNFAHVVASLQMLCYFRTGLPLRLEEDFVHTYKVGTKPEKVVDAAGYNKIKEYAAQGLQQLKADYENGYFKDFKPFVTSLGWPVGSMEAAIQYVVMHHGLHYGYAMAIKKLVS